MQLDSVTKWVVISITDVYQLDHLPKVKHLVASYRATGVPVVVTLQGDFLSPSLLSSMDKGDGMVECLIDAGVQVLCLGNHEFDHGHAILQRHLRRLHEAGVCVLNANIRGLVHEEDVMDPTRELFRCDFHGVSVAFVGGCLEDALSVSSAPDFSGTFLPLNESIRELLPRLPKSDWVVALTHQTIERDQALLAMCPSIDVVLGGHEHHVHVEERLVKPGSDAEHVAVLEFGEEDSEVKVRIVSMGDYPHEDPDLRARVLEIHHRLDQLSQFVLYRTPVPHAIDTTVVRRAPHPLIQAWWAMMARRDGADVVFANSGSLRFRGSTASWTLKDMRAMFPFQDRVVRAEIPGRVLRKLVEWSEARCDTGAYLQMWREQPIEFVRDRVYRVLSNHHLWVGVDACTPLLCYRRVYPDRVSETDEPFLSRWMDSVLTYEPQHLLQSLREFAGGDGIIQWQEWPRDELLQLVWAALDANRDGVLDVHELSG
jgi:5'-nucleotidase/UDP-sugar diphosphatase